MEDYVNKMTSTQQKLTKSGTSIPDDICAQIILTGLPEQYRPMVMAIANCGKPLTTDLVRTNLLQEVISETPNDEQVALFTKPNQKRRKPTCFACNKTGHYANKCKSKTRNTLLLASTSFIAKTHNHDEWFIDSGATAHMTMNKGKLKHIQKPTANEVIVGDSGRIAIECTGDVETKFENNSTSDMYKITAVQCIPNLCANLLSVSQLAKNGHTIIFNNENCRIFNNNKLILKAEHVDGLYKLTEKTNNNVSALIVELDKSLWHRRLGHVCEINLNKTKNAVQGVNFLNKPTEKCEVCCKGKSTRNSFKSTGSRANECIPKIEVSCGKSAKQQNKNSPNR